MASVTVLGMERSGTSLTINLLKDFGFFVDDDWKPADKYNTQGYGETGRLEEINTKILSSLGGSITNLPELSEGWEKDPRLSGLEKQARDLIRDMNSRGDWAWKSTPLIVTFPFWDQFLPEDNSVLFCIRSPLAVVKSQENMWRTSEETVGINWYARNIRAISDTRKRKRLFVFYEDYFGGDQVSRMASFLGRQLLQKKNLPSESLKHYDYSLEDNLKSPVLGSQTKMLYALIVQSKTDPRVGNLLTEIAQSSRLSSSSNSPDVEAKLVYYQKVASHPYVRFGLWLNGKIRRLKSAL